jgi:nucleotide-binding universal stress UspA family protein
MTLDRELVVGYDGGEGAKAALAEALELAADAGGRLIVVFGYEPTQRMGEAGDLTDAIEHMGQRCLDEAMATIGGRVDAKTALVPRRGAEALLAVAEERGACMIVVGATERGPLAGAVLGSVPYRLVHTTTVPVLVVPAG